MKLFSLVTIYNQGKFEKNLDSSLTEVTLDEDEEEDGFQKSSLSPPTPFMSEEL